jgi:hypothetical protein
MLRIPVSVLLCLFVAVEAYSGQSTIIEAQGYACMGMDKSRQQTEQAATAEAKRNAASLAVTYVKSETRVKDFQVEEDMLNAYSRAAVTVLETLENKWVKDELAGECFRARIKAEVIPDEKAMKDAAGSKSLSEDPGLPLQVSLSLGKNEYRSGEKMKVYLKGNKPFYARVLYRNAKGEFLQLLPNPYREDNYFHGGVVYEIPAGGDRYELEVTPPFGEEGIVLYASTSPLGGIRLEKEGAVYQVKTEPDEIGIRTRGVKITGSTGEKKQAASEFYEGKLVIKTRE